MLTQMSHFARCVACAVGLLLCLVFATPTWAGVIYELHEAGTSAVIGTLRIDSPPASRTTGWSTGDPSDLLALHLEDSLFHLGTGNLLSTAAPTLFFLFSFDGSNLDIGGFELALPIIPADPLVDPAIDRFLSFVFTPNGGGDFIGLATLTTFNGIVTPDNLVLLADASVPEPGTATLVVIGLAAAGRIARRKRR